MGQGGAVSTRAPGTQGRLGAVQTARVDVVSDVLHALESQLYERVIEEVRLYLAGQIVHQPVDATVKVDQIWGQ